jgi:excinuclease ABC subunit B
MPLFNLVSEFKPAGDQPRAISEIVQGFESGQRFQTLLGVTGSGKTFTMAGVIAQSSLPVLVISHNKTLAAQLFTEFKTFFPHNAVEYFVSYYDYYQPEAYLPATDTYIEKDADINEEIERLRLSATSSLFSRRDVIIIASVSCIYGLGSPDEYQRMSVSLKTGQIMPPEELLLKLVDVQYTRNDYDFKRGCFRVRGDVVDIHLAYNDTVVRVSYFGDNIDSLSEVDLLTGKTLRTMDHTVIFPARHFVSDMRKMEDAIGQINIELRERLAYLEECNRLVEAQRLKSRTEYDVEMLREIGYCSGIENYSRILTGRKPGERPYTLMDFYPQNFLCIIDESHVTIPQLGGMFTADRSRKEKLVEFGFRLPSALDNRPMTFKEFEDRIDKTIFVSATPAEYELKQCGGVFVEQVVRPTGLVDPEIVIKPVQNQVDDLFNEIQKRLKAGERVLVTTLTKRMAEDLTDYLCKAGVPARYLHSEIETLERTKLISELREGKFEVLVGVNLLREGLDLPEVSLVAILDADKEGFLRSTRSLIQTIGRASRNINGRVVLYADNMTGSIKKAVQETERRRSLQTAYNKKHKIEPRTVKKEIKNILEYDKLPKDDMYVVKEEDPYYFVENTDKKDLKKLERQMLKAARELDFEKAAVLRDKIRELSSMDPGKEEKRP